MRHSKEFNNIYMKVIVCYLLGTQKNCLPSTLVWYLQQRQGEEKERKKERKKEEEQQQKTMPLLPDH